MSKDVKIISLFIASPRDVVEERDLIDQVVADLNTSLCPPLGIRLEALRWERNAVPGMGESGQDVVNRNIGDDYDIFVGILANRFGTPTDRAESGTEEEFERAYARHKADPRSVHLMLYFNEQAVLPATIDPQQLAKVREFREKLGTKGALYRTYDGPKNFKDLFQVHLTSVVMSFRNIETMPKSVQVEPISESVLEEPGSGPVGQSGNVMKFTLDDLSRLEQLAVEETSLDSEEDFGVFDYLEIYNAEFGNLNEAMGQLGELNERFPIEMAKRSADLNRAAAIKDERLKLKEIRKSVAVTAKLFDVYSGVTEPNISRLAQARIRAFDALDKAVRLFAVSPDANQEQLKGLHQQMTDYEGAATGAWKSVLELQATIDGMPRFSAVLNRAQSRLSTALGHAGQEMEAQGVSAADLCNSIEMLLGPDSDA